MGRNPKTGKLIRVSPKKIPLFKPGKELKERVSSGRIINATLTPVDAPSEVFDLPKAAKA